MKGSEEEDKVAFHLTFYCHVFDFFLTFLLSYWFVVLANFHGEIVA